jgi:TRAP-type C4-dicarboxylate transport system substrate-binding protein
MLRTLFFAAAFIIVSSCGGSKPVSDAPGAGTIVLRLAESMGPDHPSAKTMEHFAALVHRRSGGKIRIRVYYEGRLGTPEEVIAQIQFGGIAMARVNGLELSETVPALQDVFRPHSYTSGATVMEQIAVERERIADACLRERLMPLVFYYPDIRCLYSEGFRFRAAADFRGIRIGTVGSRILKEALGALGAIPVDLVSADTYKSLRNGYIHARETTFSEFALSDDYRFIKNLLLSRYLASPDAIVMSPEILNGLSAGERQMIADCAAETYAYQKEQQDTFHIKWITKMREDDKDVFWEDERLKTDIGIALRR